MTIDDSTTFPELDGLLASAGLRLVRLARTAGGWAGTAHQVPRWEGMTLHQPRVWCATVSIDPAHRRDGQPFVFDGEGDDMTAAINDALAKVQATSANYLSTHP